MYSDGIPDAASAPTTDPAEVPTMCSASAARQPVSASSASMAPMSHDAPRTPPAPRTRPTRIDGESTQLDGLSKHAFGTGLGEKRNPNAAKIRCRREKLALGAPGNGTPPRGL